MADGSVGLLRVNDHSHLSCPAWCRQQSTRNCAVCAVSTTAKPKLEVLARRRGIGLEAAKTHHTRQKKDLLRLPHAAGNEPVGMLRASKIATGDDGRQTK